VIDGELIAHWEESLCALPEIREAAVVVRETADTLPPLHFDDLLPGWKSIAAGSADTAGAAPAGETTAGGAATAPEAPGVPAIAHGPALALPTGAPVTLPEALERAALEHPETASPISAPTARQPAKLIPSCSEASQRLLAGAARARPQAPGQAALPTPRSRRLRRRLLGRHARDSSRAPVHPPTYEQANSALDKLANAWRDARPPWILCGRETLPAVHSCPTCSI